MDGKDIQKQRTKFTPVTEAKTPKKPKIIQPKQDSEFIDPDMPINKIYRRKVIENSKTVEKLSWVTMDGKHHGFRTEEIRNDEDKITARLQHFDVDYSKELAEKLIAHASATNPGCQYTFKVSGGTFAVTDIENFTGNFGDLTRKAMMKEVI